MKKILKIAAITLGVILVLLFLTPVIFESQLKGLVQKTMNDRLNAKIAFSDIDLSLFRNFPNATLGIEDLSIINEAPFEGDTLAFSEQVFLQMSLTELFRSGEAMKVDALTINNTQLNIKVDSLGNNNYDIAVKDETPADTTGGFKFDMKHYEINHSRVMYQDEGANIKLVVDDLNHEGNGDLSAKTSTLSTFSTALVSLMVDDVNYLDRNKVQLEADFKMDLENERYSFLENEALVNQLPLTFDGYVQVNEDNNEVDISFKTPSSSFKNFLAVIPETYSKNIENVETSGDFVVNGFIRGIVDNTYIPKMDIKIRSNNASFKYPDLPKKVEDITIAAQVKNETGLADDTFVNIDTLNFRIDRDAFRAKGQLRDLTANMLVDMAVNGTINLANIKKAYPLDMQQDLNGMLTADMRTSFDMESIEKEQYQNVQSAGTASIRNFKYTSPEFPDDIEVAQANMKFNSGNVTLENFKATSGKTDISLNGTIENLMGYLFTDQKLKGTFNASSNTFSVNDFMMKKSAEEGEKESKVKTVSSEKAIKIPSFLDVALNFTANEVLYDNLVLKNTKGKLIINNETATLSGVTANLFNGDIALNGNVSTGQQVPTFGMKLDLNAIDIARAFRDMDLLKKLAPIAEALTGNLTTNIDLRGSLNDDLTPKLQTIAGNALAEILGAKVNPNQTPLLSQMDQSLKFISLEDLNLRDLKTHLIFNDGQVEVQPFDFNIKGIKATASGTHSFDKSMNYTLALDVPAKYLGNELGATLSKLNATQQDSMTVAIPIGLSGTFTSPKINLNMQQAVNDLSQKIIAGQTEKLKEKGKNVLTDILTKKTKKDSTSSDSKINIPIPTKKDTTSTDGGVVKEAAKNILGGLLGGQKKQKDTTEQ